MELAQKDLDLARIITACILAAVLIIKGCDIGTTMTAIITGLIFPSSAFVKKDASAPEKG